MRRRLLLASGGFPLFRRVANRRLVVHESHLLPKTAISPPLPTNSQPRIG